MKTLSDFATLLQFNPAADPAKLTKAVQSRLAAIGAGRECSRCGGCGRYSFNGSHSICYKCNGVGKVIQSLTDAVYQTAAQLVESGELAKYLDYRRAAADMGKYQSELYSSVIHGCPCAQVWVPAPTAYNPAIKEVDYSNPWNLFLAREWPAVNVAGRLAYDAQTKAAGRNLSLAERKQALAVFLPLWDDFQAKRQAFFVAVFARADYEFYWQANCDTAKACAAGVPFAHVEAMAAWQADGKKGESVSFTRE